MREHFLTEHAAEATGVPPSTVHHWTNTGVITASVAAGSGRGSTRLYGLNDVIAIRVARELREAGTGIGTIKRVTRFLYDAYDLHTEGRLLVVGRQTVDWLTEGHNGDIRVAGWFAVKQNTRTLLLVDYPGLVTEVIAAAQAADAHLRDAPRQHPRKQTALG